MNRTIKMESEVPFGRAIYAYLRCHDLHIAEIAKHDQMESHYLAWETVRKGINPYFKKGTGFEGYLVGCCPNPEAALDAILAVSQHMLDAIARLYRFRYNFRSRLFKTLTREASDPTSIQIWSGYLGMELAKLRVNVLLDRQAQNFQQQTYRIVSTLPPMSFRENGSGLFQTYAIGASVTDVPRLFVTLHALNPSQQDAWLVAENIGEFGHPLVRKCLDRP